MNRAAWTLIEITVVMAILSVLGLLTASGVQAVRQSAAKTQCQNRLKQISLALHSFHDRTGRFPIGHQQRVIVRKPDVFEDMTWIAQILPDLGETPLWDSAVRAYAQTPVYFRDPHLSFSTPLPIVQCPSDDRVREVRKSVHHGVDVGLTSYLGVAGRRAGLKDGILYNNSIIRISEITDGTSSTLIVGERPPDAGFDFGWWYAGFGIDGFGTFDSVMGVAEYDPSSIFGIGPTCGIPTVQFTAANGFEDPCGRYHFWSPHSGGANFAMADGAVRFVRYFNDPIMAALATRRGGEAVTLVE